MASQLGLIWPHLALARVWDPDGEVRLSDNLSLKLSAVRLPSRLRRSFSWTKGLEMLAHNAKQQLLVTCLDEVLQTPCCVSSLIGYAASRSRSSLRRMGLSSILVLPYIRHALRGSCLLAFSQLAAHAPCAMYVTSLLVGPGWVPVPVPVPHLFLMYSLSQCSPPCGWTPHKYIPSSLYGLDTSVYSLPLCLCGCSMCVWGGDWVTGLSGCVTGCVYLVQDKVMGIQGSLRLRS